MSRVDSWVALISILALVGACEDPTRGSRATGAPCAWGQQCVGEVCLGATLGGEATGWTGGMCTERCSDGLCPAGQVCADLGDGLYCLPGCVGAADCRLGYVCDDVLRSCVPHCDLAGCPTDLTCEEDGTCRYDWPELTPVGGPCGQDADCMDAWCLEGQDSDGPTGWNGGSCTVPCGPAGLCPPESGCMVIEGAGWCLSRCQGPGGVACRDGYICDPFMHTCVPSCANEGWDCGESYECREDGVCGPHPPPPGR